MEITERIIIIVDNSEFLNKPDGGLILRWAQNCAVQAICQTVLESSPNSKVGVVTLSRPRTLIKLETISESHINVINNRLRSLRGDCTTSLTKAYGLARNQFKSYLNLDHKDYIILFVGATAVFDDKYLTACAYILTGDKIKLSAITFGVNCISENGIPNFIKQIQELSGDASCIVVCIITEPSNANHLVRKSNDARISEIKDKFLLFEIIFDTNKFRSSVRIQEQDVSLPIVYHSTIYYSPVEGCTYFLSYGKFIQGENRFMKLCRFELPPINENKPIENGKDIGVPEKITFSDFEIKRILQG